MEYQNFSLSASKGKLYLKSKTPQDGYEKVSYGLDNTGVTYHQYHNNTKGVPKYFELKEITHEGRTLKLMELTLVDGETSNKISVPLKNRGGYTDEAKAIISALNGLELGEEVVFTPSKNKYTTKSGVEKENIQVYINYVNRKNDEGKNLSTGFIAYSDIPKPIEKIVAGDKTWDFSGATEFYYSKITEIQAKFQNSPTTSNSEIGSPPPKKQNTVVEAAAGIQKEEDRDLLPF